MLTEYLKRTRSCAIFDADYEPERKRRLLQRSSTVELDTGQPPPQAQAQPQPQAQLQDRKRKRCSLYDGGLWRCNPSDINISTEPAGKHQRQQNSVLNPPCGCGNIQNDVEGRDRQLFNPRSSTSSLIDCQLAANIQYNFIQKTEAHPLSTSSPRELRHSVLMHPVSVSANSIYEAERETMALATDASSMSPQFNSFNFWRPSLPVIDCELLSSPPLHRSPPSSLLVTAMETSEPMTPRREDVVCVAPMQSPEYSAFHFWKNPLPALTFEL